MSINRVVLIGRMTRDPEVRQTTSGKSVANFSLAVDKRIKPTDGSPTADFFNISAWGQTAEFVGNYLAKGRLVAVDGRLETRKYTRSDGTQGEAVQIIADNVQGLDRPRDGQPASKPGNDQNSLEDEYDHFADE